MRFRLRTLLIGTTIVACVLGAWSWHKYYHWRRLIPVQVRTAPLNDHRAPEEIRVRFGDKAVEALQQKHLLWKSDWESRNERPRTLNGLLVEPVYFESYGGEALVEMGIDPEIARRELLERLHSNEYEIDTKVSYALILIELEEKAGLDWLIAGIRQGSAMTSGRRELRAFNSAPDEWLDEVDVWELIRPLEYYRLNDSFHDAAAEHCPQQLYDFYLNGVRDPLTPHEWRVDMAWWFHYANPTLESLQASEFLFRHPAGDETWDSKGNFIGFLKKYIQTGDPEIKSLALEYARRMGEENKRVSKRYFGLITEYGGEQWREYLQSHLETPHLQRVVEHALIELSGEADEHYRDLLDTSLNPGDQLRGVSEMLRRHRGKNDEQLVSFLRTIFDEAEGHQSQLQYLSWLFLAGDPDAVERFATLSEGHPEQIGSYCRLMKMLDVLSRYDVGEDIDIRSVLEPLVHNGLDGYQIDEKEMLLKTLEAVGLYQRVSMELNEAVQIREFAAGSRGELSFDFVTLDFNNVTFAFEQAVYEFNTQRSRMRYAAYSAVYDPLAVADALNAILIRTRHPCRFIAYEIGSDGARFFYGPPELAKRLRDEFGIEFRAGTEEYIE
ncbi:MAG: hypothetical protein AAF456_11820 [Planctomycetota bacterium]